MENCRIAGEFLLGRSVGLQVERRLAAEPAVDHQRAARRQQREVAGNARAADRIDDGVDAAAARDRADPLADFFGLAVDDVVGAELAGEARLVVAADHADHDETGHLGQIDQRVAHAAGRRIDEHGLALPRPQRVVEDVIGDLIVGERRRGIELDAVRQDKRRLDGRRDIFGVMAAAMRPLARRGVDALADLARRDAGPTFSIVPASSVPGVAGSGGIQL